MTDRIILTRREHKSIERQGDLVYKIFDNHFPTSDVLNEALNQARVWESGLSIPKVIEIKRSEESLTIVMEYLEGQPLDKIMDENPQEAGPLMNRLVDIQLESQSRTVRLLNPMKEKMIRQISEAPLDPTIRYDLHTRVEAMPRRFKLCHGDFNPSNVLIKSDGGYAILDWSHATQGDPAAEAARTYLLFKLLEQNDRAEAYLETYCLKAGLKRNEVNKWLPIVAGCQTLKGDQREKEFLMRWVNVFDFE
ncbi:MAG: aminoglycoside phosphotransferase family protein [Deltaproteobacteria bacterium]|jgi:aminoglycoside phosphotransferase (APT) family kinase protein|nr:aminoglycoside phosphotransferase family protein [Deltaproteobacteria bacterium]